MRFDNAGLITDVFGHPVLLLEDRLPENADLSIDISDNTVRFLSGGEEIGSVQDVPEEVTFWLAQKKNLAVIAGGGDTVTHSAAVKTELEVENLGRDYAQNNLQELNAVLGEVLHGEMMGKLLEADEVEQKVLMEEWLERVRAEAFAREKEPSAFPYVQMGPDQKAEGESEEDYESRMYREFLDYLETDNNYKNSEAYLIDRTHYESAHSDPYISAMLDHLRRTGAAEFLQQARQPPEIGMRMSERIGTVSSLNGMPSEEFSDFMGKFAEKHGAKIVSMGLDIAKRAAIFGAIALVAPPLVPLAAVAYGTYKMQQAAPAIYNALKEESAEQRRNGAGKIAAMMGAAKKHKWKILGVAALGTAVAAGALGIPMAFAADAVEESAATLGANADTPEIPPIAEDSVVENPEETENAETSEDNAPGRPAVTGAPEIDGATENRATDIETPDLEMDDEDLPDDEEEENENENENENDPYADLSPQEMKDEAYKLFNGFGGEEKDVAKAVELYERAAEAGSEQAKVDLAYIRYHGLDGLPADQGAAVSLMEDLGRDRWLGGQAIPELAPEEAAAQQAAQSQPQSSFATETTADAAAQSPIDFQALPEYAAVQTALGDLIEVPDAQAGILAMLQQGDTQVPLHVYLDTQGVVRIEEVTADTMNSDKIALAGQQTLGLDRNAGWTPESGDPANVPVIPTDDIDRFLSTVDPSYTPPVPPEAATAPQNAPQGEAEPHLQSHTQTHQTPRPGGGIKI